MNDNNREFCCIFFEVSLAFRSHRKSALFKNFGSIRVKLSSKVRSSTVFKKAMMLRRKRSKKHTKIVSRRKNVEEKSVKGVNLLKTKQPKRRTTKWA